MYFIHSVYFLTVDKLANTFHLVNKISFNNKKVFFFVIEGLHQWTLCVITTGCLEEKEISSAKCITVSAPDLDRIPIKWLRKIGPVHAMKIYGRMEVSSMYS
jgi:hypothetical protein